MLSFVSTLFARLARRHRRQATTRDLRRAIGALVGDLAAAEARADLWRHAARNHERDTDRRRHDNQRGFALYAAAHGMPVAAPYRGVVDEADLVTWLLDQRDRLVGEVAALRGFRATDGQVIAEMRAALADQVVTDGAEAEAWRLAGELTNARIRIAGLEHALEVVSGRHPDGLVARIARQREFSEKTFGPGSRAKGVVAHIRKELAEIEADPTDVTEWVDVATLAFDGAWRAGYSPEEIAAAWDAKYARNVARIWPDWRTRSPDEPIEHDRSADRPAA
jgi:hypothetical protein